MEIDSKNSLIYTMGNKSVVKLALTGLVIMDEIDLKRNPSVLKLNY